MRVTITLGNGPLSNFVADVRQLAAEHGMDEFACGEPAPAEWLRWPLAIQTAAVRRAVAANCSLFGHDYVAEGYSAENGSEDLCCHRCGHSFTARF